MKKKIVLIILLIIICGFVSCNVYAANEESSNQSTQTTNNQNQSSESFEPYYGDKNCTDLAPALRIGALIIKVVRLVVPLIIIIMGSFKLFSAVLAGSADSLGKSAIDLFKRVIIAVLIFFTPSIINAFTKVMTHETNTDVNVCRRCLFENDCPEADIVDNS